MGQKKLIKWLKFLLVLVVVCGLLLCAVVFPGIGKEMVRTSPELVDYYWPWVAFMWILFIPCFFALSFALKIFSNIEKEQAFSLENAKYMERISYLAGIDTVALIIGNILFLFLNINHPSVLLLSFLVGIVGIGIAVAAAVLSHLIQKAANLQNESDLTI